MLYFKLGANGKVAKVLQDSDDRQADDVISRWDFKSFEFVQRLADEANALNDGNVYLPSDSGEWVSPRYDVIQAPMVGDPVSYAFNGDAYPDGYIIKIGGTGCSRVYTDTGSVYNRRRKSGSWIKRGGTWSLVTGHRSERNPSF